MKHFAPIRVRIERGVVTRIIRALNGQGQLNVSVGQEVTPAEIIGSAISCAGFRTLNLSQELQVAPQDTEQYLVRKLGQRIYKGELLAYKKGWLFAKKKIVISPTDGTLDFLNDKTGELRITFIPKKVSLPAGVYGIVDYIDKERGKAIIRTEVDCIHGVFGSGRLRDGILRFSSKKDALVSKDEISVKYNGQILVGGSIFFKDAISAAISVGVSGIITGGINTADYRGMAGGRLVFPRKLDNDIGISIMVCEGFGSIGIGSDIFEILSQHEGKFAFIDGNKALINLPNSASSGLVKIRNTRLPEICKNDLAALPIMERVRENWELKIGMQVRIVGNSYTGEAGKLLAIDNSVTLLPSGIKDYLATVETARRKIQVPVANLEIIV